MIKIEAGYRLEASRRLSAATYAKVDYEHWHQLMASMQTSKVEAADLWRRIADASLTKLLQKLFARFKGLIVRLSEQLGTDVKDIIEAFKTRPMYAFFRACQFSIKTLLRPLRALNDLYKQGVMTVFAELHKNGLFQRLNSGAVKIDEILSRYPLLRKLAGPAVAGLLIWMFLSGNCTYNPEMDMDLTTVIKAALQGNWSAAELFTSPDGLRALTLLIAGLATPWPSPAWLNTDMPVNILIALCYTTYKHIPNGKPVFSRIKTKIKFVKV